MNRVQVEIAGETRRAWALFTGDAMVLVVLAPPPAKPVAVRDEIRSGGETFYVHAVEDVASRGEELRLTVGRRPVPEPVVDPSEPPETTLGAVLDDPRSVPITIENRSPETLEVGVERSESGLRATVKTKGKDAS